MKENNFLSGAWLENNKSNIRVNNIPKLHESIRKVEVKQIELQEAVQELKQLYLEVNFKLED